MAKKSATRSGKRALTAGGNSESSTPAVLDSKGWVLAPVTQVGATDYRLPDELVEVPPADLKRFAGGLIPMVKFERPKTWISGAYLGAKVLNIGDRSQMIYRLAEPDTGEEFGVWGSMALDARFGAENPPAGSYLHLLFVAEVPTLRGLNPVKVFEVFRDFKRERELSGAKK